MTTITQGTSTKAKKDYIKFKVDASDNNFYAHLHIWCHLHCKGKWTTSATYVGFEKEKDATFFKLSWNK